MDVLVLIDRLDDLVHNAKAVPLTDQVRLDREEIYEILDQMRATIPEEIKQARWIVKERQEMLAEAKRECDRIIQDAREQAMREASQTEIVKLAEKQADDIVDDAKRQARETRLEMEDWADSILSTLELNLDKFLTAVKRGRERLHERSQETVVAGIGPEPLEAEESRRSIARVRRSVFASGTSASLSGRFAAGRCVARPRRRLGGELAAHGERRLGERLGRRAAVAVRVPDEADHARRDPPVEVDHRDARVVLVDREPRRHGEADAGADEALHGAVVVRAKDDVRRAAGRGELRLDVIHRAAVVEADDRVEDDLLQRRRRA